MTTLAKRINLLKKAQGFHLLPFDSLKTLAQELQVESYVAKSNLVKEGDIGDKLFILVKGKAQVTTMKAGKPVILAMLKPADYFGEVALISQAPQPRQATVTAITNVTVLVLDKNQFDRIVHNYPEAKQIFDQLINQKLIAKFLKQASPFTTFTPKQLSWLASRLEVQQVKAGAIIFAQGSYNGDSYLLRRGKVQVINPEATQELQKLLLSQELDETEAELLMRLGRLIKTMGYSAMFGINDSLKNESHHNTVIAAEDSELLVLHRQDLLQAMGFDPIVGSEILNKLQLEGFPTHIEGIESFERLRPNGERITILKNPHRGTYYKLSEQGKFIWEHLDGKHSMQDLAIDFLQQYKVFAPIAITETIVGLTATGFLKGENLGKDVISSLVKRNFWQHLFLGIYRSLNWQYWIPHTDRIITKLYHSGFKFIYTRKVQILLGIIAVAGIFAFGLLAPQVAEGVLGQQGNLALLWFFIPADLLATVLHEAGHAFTTKFFGREVNRIGVGWYWFSPIAFVDTSDMWLSDRWPRMIVGLAGPYVNLVIGSFTALIAWIWPHGTITYVLWQFALASYAIAIINLNPLLEFDGYHVLSDWADISNLRQRCLLWLSQEFPQVWHDPYRWRGHRLELAYGIASISYILMEAILIGVSYQVMVKKWALQIFSPNWATLLGWLLPVIAVLISLAGIAGDILQLKRKAIAGLVKM